MKAAFFTLFLFVLVAGRTQNITDSFPVNNEGLVEFAISGDIDKPQAVLYDRAALFISTLFPNSKAAIREANREAGYIVVKAFLPYQYYLIEQSRRRTDTTVNQGRAEISLKVFCKDGKYRVIISDIRLNGFYIWDGDQAITKEMIAEMKRSANYTSLSRYAGFYYSVSALLSTVQRGMNSVAASEF